jgi:cytochrome c2
MRRPPIVWLVTALIALMLLGGVLAWQQRRGHSQSFLEGDPVNGAFLFQAKACLHCHAISGSGGHIASDLGRVTTSGRSNLGELVTTMWNHAPEMWQRMQKEDFRAAPMTEGEVSDLFAFLYLVRYMDEQGDTARGRRLFESKGCIQCHAVRGQGGKIGPDLAAIAGIDTPIEWAQALWNHAPAMEKNISKVGVAWPRFEKSEMNDLLAYVRAVVGGPRSENKLLPADPRRGRELFNSKSCVVCHALQGEGGHTGPDLNAGRQSPLSMVQFAGVMWNHSPQMYQAMNARGVQRPVFSGQEMADLMAFFNSLRYFEANGSIEAGRGLFTSRGCSRCHGANAQGTSLAPALGGRGRHVNSVALATALWRHGPEMYRRTQTLGIPWPKLEQNDLGDLFAFLNAKPEERQK